MALSDGVLFAYISSVEVLCDPELQPFHARLGMRPATGMLVRTYERQRG